MKILITLSILFSFNSWAQKKVCFTSHMVKKGDSVYKIYSNFKYKKQYSYKKFMTAVKKENGMTKGSDILKMNNKLISIPYTCIKQKKIAHKPPQKKVIVNKRFQYKQTKKRYDPLGLASNK